MVKAVAGNKYNGKEVMRLLLQEYNQEISITEEIVEVAVDNKDNNKEILRLLL